MRIIKLIIATIKGQNSKSVFCDAVNSSPELLTRIDEHRELMFAVEKHTDLLVRKPWIKSSLLDMDNYLLKLFSTVYGRPPKKMIIFALAPLMLIVFCVVLSSILSGYGLKVSLMVVTNCLGLNGKTSISQFNPIQLLLLLTSSCLSFVHTMVCMLVSTTRLPEKADSLTWDLILPPVFIPCV